jgi:hypothetical protein
MSIEQKVNKWLSAPFDSETQEKVRALQKNRIYLRMLFILI